MTATIELATSSDVILTPDEARELYAELTGRRLSRWRLYHLAASGIWPRGDVVLREGRRVFIKRAGLEAWVANGGATPPSSAA